MLVPWFKLSECITGTVLERDTPRIFPKTSRNVPSGSPEPSVGFHADMADRTIVPHERLS